MTERRQNPTAARVRIFVTDWATLRDELDSFAETAFENGHFPNPIDHTFAGCDLCLAAKGAGDLKRRLEAISDA